MTAVGIVWVVTTPYLTGLVVAWSRLVNRMVTRHLRVSIAVGWGAIGTLFAGVFFVGGHTGMVMALASAPFAGLAVWRTGPSRDDGDDPPPEPDDEPPAPDAVGRSGRRIPAPPRKRPTGHPERRRTPHRTPGR